MIKFSDEGKIELVKAFVAAQGDMGAVVKSVKNDHFKTKYADLASVMEAVMPALTKNGLALIQSSTYEDETVEVETIIVHTGGGSMSTTLRARPQNATPQGIGSVLTYLRRYSLMAITGVAPEDDDGNAGTLSGSKPQPKPQPRPIEKEPEPSEAYKLAVDQVKVKATKEELGEWWNAQKATFKELMPPADYSKLIHAVTTRRDELDMPATDANDNPFEDAA